MNMLDVEQKTEQILSRYSESKKRGCPTTSITGPRQRVRVDAPVGRGRLKVGMVMTITRRWTVLGKLKHYLFECPTFWRRKPAFQCPHCGKKYRCYWDGNDCGGKINVCHKCADDYERLGTWNETPNAKVSGAGNEDRTD